MAAAPIGRSLRRSEDHRLLTGRGRFLDDIDPDTGQLLSGSFLDYCLPRAADLPPLDVSANGVACRTNPLCIKGAGEVGAIGAPPAVVNAVLDALNPLGVVAIDMPMTPERVWRAIRATAAA